jgi:hypothetical protein
MLSPFGFFAVRVLHGGLKREVKREVKRTFKP